MTKSFNDDINKSLRSSEFVHSADVDGFKDRDGQLPLRQYSNQSSLNKAARGGRQNTVYLGGGDITVDLGLKPASSSSYPKNQVKKTITGHIVEIDDTPGNERMLYRHRTGSGIEMRADGTVIVSSVKSNCRRRW